MTKSLKQLSSSIVLVILIVTATGSVFLKFDSYVEAAVFEKHVITVKSDFKHHTDRISAQIYQIEIAHLTEDINYLQDALSTGEITEAGKRQLGRLKLTLRTRERDWNEMALEFGG